MQMRHYHKLNQVITHSYKQMASLKPSVLPIRIEPKTLAKEISFLKIVSTTWGPMKFGPQSLGSNEAPEIKFQQRKWKVSTA